MKPASVSQEDDVEKFKVIDTGKCETLYDLFMFLKKHVEADERGKNVGEATAVHIDNKYVHIELRQFADGTREYALKGV